MHRVLLVEDEVNSTHAIAEYLETRGLEVRIARDGMEALAAAPRFAPDVLLCDWLLTGDIGGHEVVRTLLTRLPALAVVIISGLPPGKVREEAADLPVAGFLVKPAGLAEVARAVEEALPIG